MCGLEAEEGFCMLLLLQTCGYFNFSEEVGLANANAQVYILISSASRTMARNTMDGTAK